MRLRWSRTPPRPPKPRSGALPADTTPATGKNTIFKLKKNSEKIVQVLQKFDRNIGFREKRHFFAENCRKSLIILIVTSTPGQ
jgi:hypothetical protein